MKRMNPLRQAAAVICGLMCYLGIAGIGTAVGASLSYERDIRPIFQTHCFQCHGEDGARKGGLDVRLKRLLLTGGKHGAAIVPGAATKSLLFQKIRDGEMPKGGAKLPDAEIAVIRDWIESGAKTLRAEPENPDEVLVSQEDRDYWAFQPIRNPALPKPKDLKSTNPIDAFVLQQLQTNGLGFSPAADERALIRRTYFDLVGLPPTPEELNSALSISPDDLVDRLLASPHYGERWGRHWLDVAGYADSEGYTEADTERGWAWRYRDYVVRAFNDDMPFDRFIREQLAGDEMVALPHKEMPPEKIAKLTATGFLRMASDGTGSGGIDRDLARNQVISETVQIVGDALLGMTVDCARCHNHRYDPIPQRDYYQLRAIFEPALDWKNWRVPNSRRITLYTDANRKVAAEIEAKAKKVDEERKKKIEFFIDRTLTWKLQAVPGKIRKPLKAAYHTTSKKRSDEQNSLLKKYPSIRNISAGSLYLYDREYRGEVSKAKSERTAKLKQFLAAAQKKDPAAKVTEKNLAEFDPDGAKELKRLSDRAAYYQENQSDKILKGFAAKAKDIRGTKPEEQFIRALTETPGKFGDTHLFHRGNHDQLRDKIGPAELTVVSLPQNPIPTNDPALPTTGRRTAFAKRLTDGKHPLVARVLVNRMWMHHFGYGLIRTPGDFGRLGDPPTHPDLLDWLANDFMAHGWKLKRLQALILNSQTWRQSSARTKRLNELDPDNRLLGRMNVRRLEAEAIRDNMLTVSGSLNRKLFGKPVPVMEDEVGQFILGRENLDGERKPGKAVNLAGEESRRSLYVQVRRSRILSMFSTFDAPVMEPNCTLRSVSTVAPQALVFMNNTFTIRHARLMAERVQKIAKDKLDRQLQSVWEIAYARAMSADELADAKKFVAEQLQEFRERKSKEPELAALANFCQAVLSSNGFVYVD
jgi:cytochrome c553